MIRTALQAMESAINNLDVQEAIPSTPHAIIAAYASRLQQRDPFAARALQIDAQAFLAANRAVYGIAAGDLPAWCDHVDGN